MKISENRQNSYRAVLALEQYRILNWTMSNQILFVKNYKNYHQDQHSHKKEAILLRKGVKLELVNQCYSICAWPDDK